MYKDIMNGIVNEDIGLLKHAVKLVIISLGLPLTRMVPPLSPPKYQAAARPMAKANSGVNWLLASPRIPSVPKSLVNKNHSFPLT